MILISMCVLFTSLFVIEEGQAMDFGINFNDEPAKWTEEYKKWKSSLEQVPPQLEACKRRQISRYANEPEGVYL